MLKSLILSNSSKRLKLTTQAFPCYFLRNPSQPMCTIGAVFSFVRAAGSYLYCGRLTTELTLVYHILYQALIQPTNEKWANCECRRCSTGKSTERIDATKRSLTVDQSKPDMPSST